jgi:phage-related protein
VPTPKVEFWNYDEWMALIKSWPKAVRRRFGEQLREVQLGSQPKSGAKPLSGFKISLWELKRRSGQRVVYTVKYVAETNCIYVLDAFEKDSGEGSEMRVADKKRIEGRVADLKKRMGKLKAAERVKRKRLH